jgi:site-specific recombinase XerD
MATKRSILVSEDTKIVSSRRTRRTVEKEETTFDHGASKKVRISIEQELEEKYGMSRPGITAEIVEKLPVTVSGRSAITDFEDIEDAIFEEVTDDDGSIRKQMKVTSAPVTDEDIEDSFIDGSDDDVSKESIEFGDINDDCVKDELDRAMEMSRKHRMSLKAASMLKAPIDEDNKSEIAELNEYGLEKKRNVVITHYVTRQESGLNRNEYEAISAEYWDDPTYDPTVDFSMFGNPDDFNDYINLSGKTLVDCIRMYVRTKSVKNKQYRKRYRMILTYVLMVEEEWNITLYPQVIGSLFWAKFERYLYNNGLSPHSVCQLILNLRAVLKWSSGYGVKVKTDMNDINIKSVDAKPKIALSSDDISRIYWFDIDHLSCRKQHKATLKKVRDHFILSCFLGQRYSDTVRLDQTNFRGNELFKVTQQKTGNTAVLEFNRLYTEYPVHVREILERYDYMSPWKGDISNYNRYLHELMKYIGFDSEIKYEYKVCGNIITKTYKKYELISSHVARRTFITNAVKRGISTQYIKRASGHHSDESFGKYVIFDDNV